MQQTIQMPMFVNLQNAVNIQIQVITVDWPRHACLSLGMAAFARKFCSSSAGICCDWSRHGT